MSFIFFRYAGDDGDPGHLDEMHDQLKMTIQKTFNVTPELAEKLHEELIQCVKRKNLVRRKRRPFLKICFTFLYFVSETDLYREDEFYYATGNSLGA